MSEPSPHDPQARGCGDVCPPRPRGSDSSPAFDMSLPDNRRKLEATESLGTLADEAGLSIIELAIAFVVNHPA
jgi:aryl-alcohol dehydrogenase-like predicted oxidoreductase